MKSIIISIIFSVALIIGAVVVSKNGAKIPNNNPGPSNVTVISGTQIIEIRAKGGYQPRRSVAKVGVPTILRFNTVGTFDCSAAVRIPELNVSKNLPPSGVTDINIGTIIKAGVINGTCGMGMYPFELDFQS